MQQIKKYVSYLDLENVIGGRLKTKLHDTRDDVSFATFNFPILYLTIDPIFRGLYLVSGFFDRKLLLTRVVFNQEL